MTVQATILHPGIRETYDRVRRDYGAAIGRHRAELVTPALILDLPAARRNITKMADRLVTMPARIRPHIKVHKSPELARLQVEAGAIGLSCATVWEAIVLVDTGLDHIFLVNTVAGPTKIRALAELAGRADIMVAVDDADNAAALAEAARAAGSQLGVFIEVDDGMDRCGVDTPAEALDLARRLVTMPGLRFLGLTGYEGHCSLTPEKELRHQKQRTAMAMLVETAKLIVADGIPCPILSAGGTATWDWTAADPRITEIQAGSYVVMDVFHGSMVGDFENSLFVATTVISRRPDRVVIDAGNKSIGAPGLVRIVGHDLVNHRFDEEHGIFVADASTPLRVGDAVELIPGYAPATVNWYDAFHVVEGDVVVDIWPVIPRGPGHHGLVVG
jgi:D-serine deaminase-like pyridoxal phosphate-dependent protein